ncbi:TPA: SDR family NAD(P)-dependent oxidoreductase [Clostridioides difficile]|nr:SDR family NAD(P)-dependent oxidoreductase [Clostridioides difficile]
MKGTVIITGANSGIGKAATLKFASEGYRVIMACRNIKASEPICKEIIDKTKNMDIDLIELDISSKQSIYNFCEIYKKKYGVLDILIHNAGHFRHGEKNFQQSIDGIELTFATNLFGPVFMTDLLLDTLSKSKSPKILNVCSTNIKHFFDNRRKINFRILSGETVENKDYNSYQIYGDSKMALLMVTSMMAQKYKSYNINVNAIMVPATKMSKETIRKFKSYWKFLAFLQNFIIKDSETIGEIYFSICTSNAYADVTGKLINYQGQIVKIADNSLSFMKIVRSNEFYPPYVDNKEEIEKVCNICNEYIENAKLNICNKYVENVLSIKL